MTDHDALLAAICNEPDEDTPRLALADWLDENDEPEQAAFIRAQIELARTPPWEPFAVLCRWRQRDWLTGKPFRDHASPGRWLFTSSGTRRHSTAAWAGGSTSARSCAWEQSERAILGRAPVGADAPLERRDARRLAALRGIADDAEPARGPPRRQPDRTAPGPARDTGGRSDHRHLFRTRQRRGHRRSWWRTCLHRRSERPVRGLHFHMGYDEAIDEIGREHWNNHPHYSGFLYERWGSPQTHIDHLLSEMRRIVPDRARSRRQST